MKKIFFATVMAMVLVSAIAGLASANGGPHGGYNATSDGCAGCHRAHTATGGKLLIANSTYALCMTCHGAAATGADTDVITGIYDGLESGGEGVVNDPLNSGLFDASATSTHDVSGTVTQAWGATAGAGRGVLAAAAALATGLDCASCHDPHGTTGYRLLTAGAVPDYDSGSKSYTVDGWTGTELSGFCATCHTAYHETGADVGHDPANLTVGGNGTYTYTHRIDMVWNAAGTSGATFGPNNPESVGYDGVASTGDEIPLVSTGEAVCTTCHFAHGTTAVMANESLAAGPAGNVGSSALLRLDGRGVCQACHQK